MDERWTDEADLTPFKRHKNTFRPGKFREILSRHFCAVNRWSLAYTCLMRPPRYRVNVAISFTTRYSPWLRKTRGKFFRR